MLRLQYTRLFPDPRFFLFVLQNIAGSKKSGSMSASMKWRYLDHLQLLSNTVAAMAEMEASPQEEMANPQGMKVFAVERPELSEKFTHRTTQLKITRVNSFSHNSAVSYTT